LRRFFFAALGCLLCGYPLAAESVSAGGIATVSVPLWNVLTLSGSGATCVSTRLSDIPGGQSQGSTAISGSAVETVGPFSTETRHSITCTTGSVSYSYAPASFVVTGGILASDIEAADDPADEECLTYDATGPALEWQACGGAGLDDGDYGDVAVSGGGTVLTVEAGAATTATALAANGANCSAGNYPLGVDASGAVESCTAISGGIGGSTGATDDALLCADGTGGSTVGACTVGNLDNLRLDGNILSTTNSNGDLVIDPNGTGALRLDSTSGVHSLLFGDNSIATGIGWVYNPANDAGRLRLYVTGSEKVALTSLGFGLGPSASLNAGPDLIGNNLDVRLERQAANGWEIVGGRATDTVAFLQRMADASGSYEKTGCAGTSCSESVTLDTGSTSTVTAGNIVSASSDIEAIAVRVTTTITTAVNFTVAPTGKNAFCIKGTTTSSLTTLTAGTTYVLGPCPATYGADLQNQNATTVTITTNANPGAGAVRVTVFPHLFSPPST
jgi:hypothetical protein